MSLDGTIFLYPKTITATDPSAFKSISGSRTETKVLMYDRDANNGAGAFVNVDALVFDVSYDDQITMQVRVRKSDYTDAYAARLARQYAVMMGQLPAVLREGVKFLNILKSDNSWGGNFTLKAMDVTIGKTSEGYEKQGILEETLIHEGCHCALDGNFYGVKDWDDAQKNDPLFISKYALDNPKREDVAESFGPYLAAVLRPSRITAQDAQKIKDAIPNRIKVFTDRKLNMYPIVAERPVSTTEVKDVSELLFPNPTKGLVQFRNLKFDNLQVFDQAGRLVQQYTQFTPEIDLRALPAGAYFLKITTDEQAYSAKLVKE
jgi:Secretion system C-terminal sorting domain